MGHTAIDDNDDNFEVSGPTHMRSNDVVPKIVIDWDNARHRRCAMACLVKGTYVMENDYTQRRDAKLAPAWWKSYGFEKEKSFINDTVPNDKFTYGAIFKLVDDPRPPSAPEYVVAFRGTMLCHPKFMEELVQDFWVLFNAVTDYTRFKRIDPEVDEYMKISDSVWLAGHSLGASMALEIGRNQMLQKARRMPTFLFNPPHVSPASMIQEEHKTGVYTASFKLKFLLANMMPRYHQRTKKLFQQLAHWAPELYVNQDDTICRGYIDYFVQLQLVYKDHPKIAKTAGRVSYRDMLFSMVNNKSQPHLLPSVRLWTSSTHKKEAHGLRQWWKSDSQLQLTCRSYGYPLNADA